MGPSSFRSLVRGRKRRSRGDRPSAGEAFQDELVFAELAIRRTGDKGSPPDRFGPVLLQLVVPAKENFPTRIVIGF
jgi:hypothetical protein